MKRRSVVLLIIAAVTALVIVFFAGGISVLVLSLHPIVICDYELPDGYLDDIVSQAKGFYSERLPLVAAVISVYDYRDDAAFYTIYYFPFGTVGMTYAGNGGFDCYKYLTGLQ